MHDHTHTTEYGTPCAKSWTEDWIATVHAKETDCAHRICGAKLPSGLPCTLTSDHPSGRCRHHGGFDLTGAPEGNRNAILHNLYSRRLMPCGDHCPMWQSCPLTRPLTPQQKKQKHWLENSPAAPNLTTDERIRRATFPRPPKPDDTQHRATENTESALIDEDPLRPSASSAVKKGTSTKNHVNHVKKNTAPKATHSPLPQGEDQGEGGPKNIAPKAALEYADQLMALHPADRPTCPYEQTEYNTAVSEGLRRVTAKYAMGYARHVIHQLALAQVMVTRAGLALRQAEFTQSTTITSANYNMTTPKISPALTAYEKLERAWRRLLNDFERIYATEYPPNNHHDQFNDRIKTDTPLDPDSQARHYESMNPNNPTNGRAGVQPMKLAREGEAPAEPHAPPIDSAHHEVPPPKTPTPHTSIPTGRSADPHVRLEDPWVQLPTGRLRRSEYMRQLNEMMGKDPTKESTDTDGLPPP